MSDLRMKLIQGQLNDIEENVRSIKTTWGNTIMTLDNIKSGLKADRQKAIDEAYHKGFEAGSHEATTLEYQQGLNDAWGTIIKIALIPYAERSEIFDGQQDILSIVQKFSQSEVTAKLREYEQQKADKIKVGDIITDGKISYLVIDITDKSYIALQGTDFEPAYIGKDYIKSYHNLHDPKDMQKIAEEISKAMKGEQEKERFCSSCEYCNDPDGVRCRDCCGYNKWQPKEGAK